MLARSVAAGLVLAAGLVAGPLVGGAATVPRATAGEAPRAAAADPVRVLLLGDSLVQGAAGDWTWRYRLWQDEVAAGAAVDLVGCATGLFDLRTQARDSPAYVDPAFDRDHCGWWGNSLAHPAYDAGRLAATYAPDVLVVQLGINDLARGRLGLDALVARFEALVTAARGARPGIAVVLMDLPQTWTPGVGPLNDALAALAARLDGPQGRVVRATTDPLVRRRDTWDGRHLTATGEVAVGAAAADALAALGIGRVQPRPLPAVANGPRAAPALRARTGGGFVALRWGRVPGVDRVVVWHRRLGPRARTAWRSFHHATVGRRLLLGPFASGTRIRFRLQPARGRVRSPDVRSAAVTVTVR